MKSFLNKFSRYKSKKKGAFKNGKNAENKRVLFADETGEHAESAYEEESAEKKNKHILGNYIGYGIAYRRYVHSEHRGERTKDGIR